MERQLDYDVVPADMLRENTASIEEGQLVLGKEKYPCLILPFSRYLDGETARFLVSAARKGLKVFVIDALPEADTLGRPLPRAGIRVRRQSAFRKSGKPWKNGKKSWETGSLR